MKTFVLVIEPDTYISSGDFESREAAEEYFGPLRPGWALVEEPGPIEFVSEKINRLESELAERDALFKRMYDADMRGIQLWRAESPEERDLVWPSQDKLVQWLIEQVVESRNLLDTPLRVTDPKTNVQLTMTVREVAIAEQNFRKQSPVVDKSTK